MTTTEAKADTGVAKAGKTLENGDAAGDLIEQLVAQARDKGLADRSGPFSTAPPNRPCVRVGSHRAPRRLLPRISVALSAGYVGTQGCGEVKEMVAAVTSRRVAIVGQGSASRETVFQAALRCFYLHGYHAASMRDIAKAGGVTPAAIYHYYESKQELLMDVISRFMDRSIKTTIMAISEADDNPAAQLFAAARSHVLWNASDVVSSFVVNSEIRSLEPHNRQRNIAQRDELQRLFDAVVERGASEGAFATPWPKEASRAVVTMCTSVARWYKSAGPLSPNEIADRYGHMSLWLVGASNRGDH